MRLPSSSPRKRGWATAIRDAARSRSPRPLSRAVPCSVTTTSATKRGVVTAEPGARRYTMRETAPSRPVEGNAMTLAPPREREAPSTKSN